MRAEGFGVYGEVRVCGVVIEEEGGVEGGDGVVGCEGCFAARAVGWRGG